MRFIKYLARLILRKELALLKSTIESDKVVKTEVRVNLPREVFLAFKEGFERPIITSNTTDLQAAQIVGMQRVFDALERKHVAG